jgi:membrane-associated phospholipid phosphatase
MRLAFIIAFAAVCCVHPGRLRADEVVHPWEHLGDGIVDSFMWPSLLWHASAVAITPALVWTSDAPVQEFFQKQNPLGEGFADVTLVAGAITPVAVPLGFYLAGLARDAPEFATAGAGLQAVAVETLIVTTLKWLTDRAGPFPDGDPGRGPPFNGLFHDSKDPKHFNFNPFDLSGGLRWPSGHTASNMALVSALVAFYPDQPWIAALGYPLVLAIGLGMVEGDYHWLSDVVAGALIGHIIGWTIGRQFRARYDERARTAARGCGDRPSALTLAPLVSGHATGLMMFGRL